eukprot:TRINITY_DN7464_c0_g1_i1.p1 TRINITY_DN7464_c0_g1~~TRINITY_DN7464_c0_g1_i1.p1  ORF type:complete len:874 (+),score=164.90 TRINITY_DN7464_c0_g1_i1:93-2714(+)
MSSYKSLFSGLSRSASSPITQPDDDSPNDSPRQSYSVFRPIGHEPVSTMIPVVRTNSTPVTSLFSPTSAMTGRDSRTVSLSAVYADSPLQQLLQTMHMQDPDNLVVRSITDTAALFHMDAEGEFCRLRLIFRQIEALVSSEVRRECLCRAAATGSIKAKSNSSKKRNGATVTSTPIIPHHHSSTSLSASLPSPHHHYFEISQHTRGSSHSEFSSQSPSESEDPEHQQIISMLSNVAPDCEAWFLQCFILSKGEITLVKWFEQLIKTAAAQDGTKKSSSKSDWIELSPEDLALLQPTIRWVLRLGALIRKCKRNQLHYVCSGALELLKQVEALEAGTGSRLAELVKVKTIRDVELGVELSEIQEADPTCPLIQMVRILSSCTKPSYAAGNTGAPLATMMILFEALTGEIAKVSDAQADDMKNEESIIIFANNIEDPFVLRLLTLAMSSCCDGETFTRCLEYISTMVISNASNSKLVFGLEEWPRWILSMLTSGSEDPMAPRQVSTAESKQDKGDKKLRKQRKRSWRRALNDHSEKYKFQLEMNLFSKLLSSALSMEENNEKVREWLEQIMEILSLSDDLIRVILFSTLASLSSDGLIRNATIESPVYKNITEFLDLVLHFCFYSGSAGAASTSNDSIAVHIGEDCELLDQVLTAQSLSIVDKLLTNPCFDHINEALGGSPSSPFLDATTKENIRYFKLTEKVKKNLLVYKEFFQISDRFFQLIQDDEISPMNFDSLEKEIRDMARILDKHSPKANQPRSPQEIFSKLLGSKAEREDEIDEALRGFLMGYFQRKYAAGSSKGKDKKQAEMIQDMFDSRRSALGTNVVFAHNLVRMKLGKKALVPKDSEMMSTQTMDFARMTSFASTRNLPDLKEE